MNGKTERGTSGTVENVVCTFCGCLCDDISVDTDSGRIVKVRGACANGRTFFENYHAGPVSPRVGGRDVSWDEAISEAGRILANARSPLIYGFSSSSSEAQRQAVRLGDILGAVMDTTSSVCHGPTGLAMQAAGESTCTLGEVRNRADLLLFWGCNPVASHTRHFTRYSLSASGRYTEGGRAARKSFIVDVRPTQSTKSCDRFFQIEPGCDYEVLHALRLIVKGRSVRGPVGGLRGDELAGMAAELKSCRYGVAFMGMGLTMTRGRDMNVRELFSLVTDLNEHTRFCVMPMRGHGNVTGADQVFTWLTGFPFAVSLSRGYPRYGPGEYTAVDSLANREVDAALILSSDPGAHFPKAAADRLRELPAIVMDPEKSISAESAAVWFPVSKYGVDCPGTAYRMDTVPIYARAFLAQSRMSDEEILTRLIEEVSP